jgi:hypothetical protein
MNSTTSKPIPRAEQPQRQTELAATERELRAALARKNDPRLDYLPLPDLMKATQAMQRRAKEEK